jgi:hypothetical protein
MRAGSRVLAAGLALIAFASSGVSMVAAQESEGGITDAQAATLQRVATCLRTTDHLLVSFVIDESTSLTETDPENKRVDAALLALDNFTDLATTEIAGRTPTIEAHVAGFAHAFTPYAGWGDLADANAQDEIRSALEDFADREEGLATDIPTALNEARQVIADRAAELSGGEPCKVLLLFTDGRYELPFFEDSDENNLVYAPDVDPSTDGAQREAERLGREFVCSPNGVAEQLRDDGVVTLTAALATTIAPRDEQFLEALSTGRAGTVRCPGDANPRFGAYLPAEDVDELVPVFNGIVEAVGGGTIGGPESVEGVCVGEPCDAGRHEFELSPALAGFGALLEVREAGISVLVEGPDGTDETADIEPDVDGDTELAGSDLEWEWIDEDTVRLTGELPADARDEWAGDWALTFLADREPATATPPRATLTYFTGLLPQIVGEPELVRGEISTVVIDIVDVSGEVVDPADLGADVTLDATITDPATGASEPAQVTGSGGSYEVQVESVGTGSTVALEASVNTTLQNGRVLAPQSDVFDLPVRAAALFPLLSPARLQLESVRGTGETTAELTITGGADAGGCVWFETPVDVRSAPVSAISAQFVPSSTSNRCLDVEAGKSRTVVVRFKNSESGEGVVRGTITATLLSRETREEESFEIPFSFDLAPPINEAERFGLFLAILLPGVLAPIAFLALSNRRLARFRSTTGVQVARVPVLVERTLTQILRVFADGGATGETALRLRGNEVDPIVLRPDDFTPMGKQKGTHVDAADLTFVARAPSNPFGEVGATVEAHDGLVAARVVGDSRSDESHLPLALPGTWAVALPSDGTPVTGNGLDATLPGGDERQWIRVDLVAFVADGSLGSQLTALRGDLGARLSDVANVLADRVEGIDRTGSGRFRDWA